MFENPPDEKKITASGITVASFTGASEVWSEAWPIGCLSGEIFHHRSRVFLVGGFNPSEKYESKWVHLPQTFGVKIKK